MSAGGRLAVQVDLERDPVEDRAEAGAQAGARPADAVQVRGAVRMPDGATLPFVGWVGLLAILQQAVSAP
jgi:hypothetical protein